MVPTKVFAMKIMKYRKKPVVIEAIQWDGSSECMAQIHEFCEGEFGFSDKEKKLKIYTLEGTMEAQVGDWIIKGVKGELYPCKPDIFEVTYEPAV